MGLFLPQGARIRERADGFEGRARPVLETDQVQGSARKEVVNGKTKHALEAGNGFGRARIPEVSGSARRRERSAETLFEGEDLRRGLREARRDEGPGSLPEGSAPAPILIGAA